MAASSALSVVGTLFNNPVAAAFGAVALVVVAWAASWTRLPRDFKLELPLDIAKQTAAIKFPQYEVAPSVLITGGCGFLGRHLVDALVTQKGVKTIVVFDIVTAAFEDPRVVVVKGNLAHAKGADELAAVLRKHGVGAVFHVASPHPNSLNKQIFVDVNVTGTANVVQACLDAGVRTLVYTSSASVVWQGSAQEGVDESVPVPSVFRDKYAETKAMAERIVMDAGVKHKARLTTIALRPHAIFGPRDQQAIGQAVAVAKQGKLKFVVGDGNNIVDWTYVGNVVHSHLLAAQAGERAGPGACAASGRTYFITNDEPMPAWEFLNWVGQGLGYAGSSLRLPLNLLLPFAALAEVVYSALNARRPADKQLQVMFSTPRLKIVATSHFYSIAAAKRDLGYAPLWNMKQAIYDTLTAFKSQRNPHPPAAVLARARAGNLVTLGLVIDPEASASGYRSGGANTGLRDVASLPEYTRAQVAAHASAADAWVVIDCLVYDLTSFVPDHPGGRAALLQHVGGDASAGFHGDQHPSHVADTVKKFVTGRLAKE